MVFVMMIPSHVYDSCVYDEWTWSYKYKWTMGLCEWTMGVMIGIYSSKTNSDLFIKVSFNF